ncbi:MAG: sensor domain-containing diguanylate cyclase [candidate division Zixibacteria bacterium]|nr:sensor domain-containing diguanylate cyclase [candidate division Zixibacteria bacterium]
MKLFLDRHKTLLPRVDVVYLLTRLMTLTGISWFTFFGDYPSSETTFFYILIGTFVLQLAVFGLAMRNRFDVKLAYFLSIVYDLIFVPVFIYYTGGLDSSFYLLMYLTASVAAYVLTFWFGLAVSALLVIAYMAIVYSEITLQNWFGLSMRIGFLWVYYLAISYASEYLRRSEKRLLKVFDTLNMRTSELEKSQAQLEMMYENTRILGSMLDTTGVIKETSRILADVLQLERFAMILGDTKGNFLYRVRHENGRTNFHLKAIEAADIALVGKVCQMDEPITVKDIAGRDDYLPLGERTRSVMIVPLTAHGRTMGALVAEDDRPDAFREREHQMLSVVTRSTAMALENAELHRRTEELTISDELTDTYNYRYFVQKLEEEKRRALRYDLPLSLIMVDIDWFKKLNDTYGHEVGNIVLKRLSMLIKDCIRDVDMFFRFGGEEFVIILPQTPLSEARRIGERIREHVEGTIIEAGSVGKLKITVSCGVSSFPENGKSQDELLSVADQALYRAKGEGRNLVCSI